METYTNSVEEPPFYYDPDFRRTHIHPRDVTKPYCCRCMMNVDPTKAIPVSINEETWMALEGHDRHEEIRTNFSTQAKGLVANSYIGKDCRRALRKSALNTQPEGDK